MGSMPVAVNHLIPGYLSQPGQLPPGRQSGERLIVERGHKNLQQQVFGILLVRYLLTQVGQDG